MTNTKKRWGYFTPAKLPLEDRLFVGIRPTGLSYCDKGIEVDADYKRVAFLPYSTLTLEVYDQTSPLLTEIERSAAKIQAMRGQWFRTDVCGHGVVLGGAA